MTDFSVAYWSLFKGPRFESLWSSKLSDYISEVKLILYVENVSGVDKTNKTAPLFKYLAHYLCILNTLINYQSSLLGGHWGSQSISLFMNLPLLESKLQFE